MWDLDYISFDSLWLGSVVFMAQQKITLRRPFACKCRCNCSIVSHIKYFWAKIQFSHKTLFSIFYQKICIFWKIRDETILIVWLHIILSNLGDLSEFTLCYKETLLLNVSCTYMFDFYKGCVRCIFSDHKDIKPISRKINLTPTFVWWNCKKRCLLSSCLGGNIS